LLCPAPPWARPLPISCPHTPHTPTQEYARKKHAGSQWALDRLDANLQRQDEKRERKRGYRATATAAAKQAVTQYGARSLVLCRGLGVNLQPPSALHKPLGKDDRRGGGGAGAAHTQGLRAACSHAQCAPAHLVIWGSAVCIFSKAWHTGGGPPSTPFRSGSMWFPVAQQATGMSSTIVRAVALVPSNGSGFSGTLTLGPCLRCSLGPQRTQDRVESCCVTAGGRVLLLVVHHCHCLKVYSVGSAPPSLLLQQEQSAVEPSTRSALHTQGLLIGLSSILALLCL